jgi:hypothetical protein
VADRVVDTDNAIAMANAVLLMMDLFISASDYSNEDASATARRAADFPFIATLDGRKRRASCRKAS